MWQQKKWIQPLNANSHDIEQIKKSEKYLGELMDCQDLNNNNKIIEMKVLEYLLLQKTTKNLFDYGVLNYPDMIDNFLDKKGNYSKLEWEKRRKKLLIKNERKNLNSKVFKKTKQKKAIL